jgi:hypothetical protein
VPPLPLPAVKGFVDGIKGGGRIGGIHGR